MPCMTQALYFLVMYCCAQYLYRGLVFALLLVLYSGMSWQAKKGHGGKYSAVATFKTLQEALSTYDKLQGVEEKVCNSSPRFF